MKYYCALAISLLLPLMPAIIIAQESTPEQERPLPAPPPRHPIYPPISPDEPLLPKTLEPEPNYLYAEFFKMISVLIFIIIILLLLMWFLKKVMTSRLEQLNVSSLIKIVERRSLTPRTSLYIIEVFNKKLAIAETHQEVTVLAESSLSEPSSFERLLDKEEEAE